MTPRNIRRLLHRGIAPLLILPALGEPSARLQYEEVYEVTSSTDSVGGAPANGIHKSWPALTVYTPPSDAFLQINAPGGVRHTYREFPMFYGWDDTTDTFTMTPVTQPLNGKFWAEVGHAPGAAKVTPELTMTRDADDWTWPAGQASKNFTVRISLTATQDFIDDNVQMKIYPHVSWSGVPGVTCDAVAFRDDPADLFTYTSMDGSRIEKVYGDPDRMTAGTTYTVEFDMQCQRGDTLMAILFKPAFQINYRPATMYAAGAISTQSTLMAGNGVSITGHTSDMREFSGEIDDDTYGLHLTPYAAAIGAPVVSNTSVWRKTITALTGDTFEEIGVSVGGSQIVSGTVQTPTGGTYQLIGYGQGDGISMSAETQDAALIADFTAGTYSMSVVGSNGTTDTYQFTAGAFTLPTQTPDLVTAAFETTDPTPLIQWLPVTDPTVDAIAVNCYGQNDYYDHFSGDASSASWQLTDSLNEDGYMLAIEFLTYESTTDTTGRDVYIDTARSTRSFFNVIPDPTLVPEIAVEQPAGEEVGNDGSCRFGAVLPGESTSLEFTIRNSGNDELTGLTITTDGPDAGDFTVTADPVAPVAAAGTTTFTIAFSPDEFGAKTATIHIASNDHDKNPYDIVLTGQGAAGRQIIGDGILGVVPQSAGTDRSDSGRLTAHSQGPAALNDGNPATRSTTFRPSGNSGAPSSPYTGPLHDYAGMRFDAPRNGIAEIQINPVVFGDGGWWISGTLEVQVTSDPALSAVPLPGVPNPNGSDSRIVEISTDDDIWTAVAFTTDYPDDATVGSAGSIVSNTSYAFYLNTPMDNITAIRVIGNPAGNTSLSPNEGDLKFIGVSEIAVFSVSDSPDIAVAQPAGVALPDGHARDFGITGTDDHADLVFTITNEGDGDLTGLTTSISGTDAVDFEVVQVPTPPLAPGGTTTMTVRFAPLSGGAKTATLELVSNDPDENPFEVSLTGRALSAEDDTDGDGLNDLAEFRMTLLCFDWETAQPDMVAALMDHADLAGLFTEEQVGNVHPAASLIKVQNGSLTINFQLKKSDDLMSWENVGDPIQWTQPTTGDDAFYRFFVETP